MGDSSMLSPSDIALLSNNDGMFGGNSMSMIWLFAILLLFGNGGWGNNFNNAIGYENLATSNEVQRGFDNQNLQAQTRDILSNVTAGTAQAVAATNQAKYDNINVMKDVQAALTAQINDVKGIEQNLLANQNECCCSTKMLISETGNNIAAQLAQNKYENAMQISQMEARLTAKMDANKIEELQNQVNQLQLAQATAGMLKFPNSWSYGAGPFPPIFGGCGYGNGNI